MPTDETTLEALERLAERYERQAAHHARDAHDFAESPVPVLRLTAPELAKQAAENALIADALRFKLAALTARAAQEGDPESDEAFFARIHARRKARQAQTFAEENQ